MAEKWTTWVGGASSVWDTAGNWSNGVPDADDTAVIDGAVSITGGTVTANDIKRLYVARSYTGAIGSTGTPLEVDVDNLSVDNNAAGSTHYIHLLGSTFTTPTVTVKGLKVGAALYISGTINLAIFEPTLLGTVYIGNSASKTAVIKDLVLLSTAGSVDASTAANVAWASSAAVDVMSGNLTLGENVGTNSTLTMSGGTVTVSGWTATTGDTFRVLGGIVKWNAGSTGLSASAVNAVNTVELLGGSFSLEANENIFVGFGTVTQFAGDLNLNSSFANVDITVAYNRYGGTFAPSAQVAITQTPK